MKLFIALLFVCALKGAFSIESNDNYLNHQNPLALTLANQYESFQEPRLDILRLLQELINQAIQSTIRAAENLRVRVVNLLQGVVESIQRIQSDANKVLGDIEKNLENTLESYKNASTCAAEHSEAIRNITKKARKDIVDCIKNATNDVYKVREDVLQYAESIASQISQIAGIIDKCSNVKNPIGTAICAVEHLKNVTDAVTNIYNDGREAVRLASIEIYELTIKSNVCVLNVLENARTEIRNVVNLINECISQNQLNVPAFVLV